MPLHRGEGMTAAQRPAFTPTLETAPTTAPSADNTMRRNGPASRPYGRSAVAPPGRAWTPALDSARPQPAQQGRKQRGPRLDTGHSFRDDPSAGAEGSERLRRGPGGSGRPGRGAGGPCGATRAGTRDGALDPGLVLGLAGLLPHRPCDTDGGGAPHDLHEYDVPAQRALTRRAGHVPPAAGEGSLVTRHAAHEPEFLTPRR